MRYIKQFLNIVLVTLISCTVPLQAQIFKDQKNNIALTVVDYADNPDALLYYKDARAIRANTLMSLGAHPLHVIIENKSGNPIELNQKSIFLTLYLLPEEQKVNFNTTKTVFGFCGGTTALATAIAFINDDSYYYPTYKLTFATMVVGSFFTAYMTFMAWVMDFANAQIQSMFFDLNYILHKPITIEPGKKVEVIMLLTPQGYKRLFNFRVFDKDAQDIAAVFDVDLRTA